MFFFSFIGILVAGTFVHENIHRWDFRNVTKLTEDICYLNSDIEAYYSYVIPPDQEEIANEIGKKTEFRAYGVKGVIMLIYLFAFAISFKYIINKNENT